jgi:hypothetical protein
MSAPSISFTTGFLWAVFGGATQGDPEDGSFSFLGRFHLFSSFFRILYCGRVTIIEPYLFPWWNLHLFEY